MAKATACLGTPQESSLNQQPKAPTNHCNSRAAFALLGTAVVAHPDFSRPLSNAIAPHGGNETCEHFEELFEVVSCIKYAR